jgi:hypothetical protein
LHHEAWFEFGRFVGEPCTGGMTAVMAPGAQHTLSFVLPPETEDPALIVSKLVEQAALRQPFARYAIKVAGEPYVERMSRTAYSDM